MNTNKLFVESNPKQNDVLRWIPLCHP